MENGLAWQPDGHRLFVVTENSGLIGFRALNEPVATAIKLTAPATADRAIPLTITGTITGSVPAGTALSVNRDDLESDSIPLPDATTDASGNSRSPTSHRRAETSPTSSGTPATTRIVHS